MVTGSDEEPDLLAKHKAIVLHAAPQGQCAIFAIANSKSGEAADFSKDVGIMA